MVLADTHRLGCAGGEYQNGYALICNFYRKAQINDRGGIIGVPANQCPRELPRSSVRFPHLCTAGKQQIFS